MNEEISTRLSKPEDNISPLDSTIVSQDISRNCEWEFFNDSGNSDHFPILCKIGSSNLDVRFEIFNLNKRNYRKAKWGEYYDFIEVEIGKTHLDSYDQIIALMHLAADRFIPKIKLQINNIPKNIWWDELFRDMFRTY